MPQEYLPQAAIVNILNKVVKGLSAHYVGCCVGIGGERYYAFVKRQTTIGEMERGREGIVPLVAVHASLRHDGHPATANLKGVVAFEYVPKQRNFYENVVGGEIPEQIRQYGITTVPDYREILERVRNIGAITIPFDSQNRSVQCWVNYRHIGAEGDRNNYIVYISFVPIQGWEKMSIPIR